MKRQEQALVQEEYSSEVEESSEAENFTDEEIVKSYQKKWKATAVFQTPPPLPSAPWVQPRERLYIKCRSIICMGFYCLTI